MNHHELTAQPEVYQHHPHTHPRRPPRPDRDTDDCGAQWIGPKPTWTANAINTERRKAL